MSEKVSKRDKIMLAIFIFVTITAGSFGYFVDQLLTEQPEGNSLGNVACYILYVFPAGQIFY